MAKMQKLDPKDTPKVIAMGVLAVGMFGYFAMQMVGPPRKPAPAAKKGDAQVKQASAAAEAAPVDQEQLQKDLSRFGATGSVFNPDPFRPAKLPNQIRKPAPATKTQAAPAEKIVRGPGALPGVPYGIAPGSVGAPAPPPAQALPVQLPRPELTLSGIIDAQDGADMAVAQMGQESVILKVGDRLPNDYKVLKVTLQGEKAAGGLWCENKPAKGQKKDRFFIPLGGHTPALPTPGAAAGSGPAQATPASQQVMPASQTVPAGQAPGRPTGL